MSQTGATGLLLQQLMPAMRLLMLACQRPSVSELRPDIALPWCCQLLSPLLLSMLLRRPLPLLLLPLLVPLLLPIDVLRRLLPLLVPLLLSAAVLLRLRLAHS